eukprot:6762602-Ditylum_brightwellii.AAC.1
MSGRIGMLIGAVKVAGCVLAERHRRNGSFSWGVTAVREYHPPIALGWGCALRLLQVLVWPWREM